MGSSLRRSCATYEAQVAGVVRVVRPPDLAEEHLPGEQLAGVLEEQLQQPPLRGGQANGCRGAAVGVRRCRASDRLGREVDDEARRSRLSRHPTRRPPTRAPGPGCGRAARPWRRASSRSRRRRRRGPRPSRRSRCVPTARGSAHWTRRARARITSTPSTCGMPRSSSTRSGCALAASVDRLGAVAGRDHVVPAGGQRDAQRPLTAAASSSATRIFIGASSAVAAGSVTTIVSPPPGVSSASSVPSMPSTKPFDSASPRPEAGRRCRCRRGAGTA